MIEQDNDILLELDGQISIILSIEHDCTDFPKIMNTLIYLTA